MAYLIKTIETYRLPSEESADVFLKEMKENPVFEVIKHVTTKKDIKEKGEIVESYYKVEVTKVFNEEKYPNSEIDIEYKKEF